MLGKTFGPYQILERLGQGGMGEVYLAEDLKLKRKAAIKFISAALVRDEAQRLRFVQEATLAASIDHPHIAAIYDVDQIDGQTFIAMEYVRGKTLRAFLKDGALPLRRALDLGIEIADALAKVHQLGVTHRDLKPDNVIVSDDGYAKIIDFGLAKLTERVPAAVDAATELQVKTAEGMLLGTVAYMSPEQARADVVDARSDIFSFGVLLYEAVTGVAPFKRPSSAESLSAILTEPVPPLALKDDAMVSPELQRIIRKCTAKDRESRYQSMREVVVDLRSVREMVAAARQSTTMTAAAVPPPPARSPRAVARIAGAAIVVAAVAWLGWTYGRPAPAAPAAVSASPARPAIAIMPFENLGGATDIAWMTNGLSSLLLTGLSQNPEIQMVTRDRLDDAATQMGKGTFDAVEASSRAQVAKHAGATFVVNGTIVKAGDELRIDARVEDLAKGSVVLADSVRGSDPLTLADDLAARIRTRLDVRPQERVRPVAQLTSASLDAYRAYSEGIEAIQNVRTEDGKRLFLQALAIDPDFALAHYGLSIVYSFSGEAALSVKHLNAAAAHLDRLPELDALLVRGALAWNEGRIPDAAAVFDLAISKYPESFVAAVNRYTLYEAAGDSARAVAVFERFMQAVPSSGPGWNLMGYGLLADGRPDEAVAAFEKYLRLRPNEPNALDSLAEGQLAQGELAAALATAQRAIAAGRAGSNVTLNWIMNAQGRLADVLATGNTPGTGKILTLSHLGRHREAETARQGQLATARKNEDSGRVVMIEALGAMLALERGDCTAVEALVRSATQTGDANPRGNLYLATGQIFGLLLTGTCDARAGKLPDARARLDQARRLMSPPSRIHRWWTELLDGEIALAAGDAAAAAAIFRRAEPAKPMPFNRSGQSAFLTTFTHSLMLKDGLARALATQNQLDAAIAEYRKLLEVKRGSKFVGVYEPRYLLAIARLLDQQGKKAEARAEYQRFVELWKGADAGSPELAEARDKAR